MQSIQFPMDTQPKTVWKASIFSLVTGTQELRSLMYVYMLILQVNFYYYVLCHLVYNDKYKLVAQRAKGKNFSTEFN